MPRHPDGLLIAALLFLSFMTYNVIRDVMGTSVEPSNWGSVPALAAGIGADQIPPGEVQPTPEAVLATQAVSQATAPSPGPVLDPNAIALPYTQFVVTQGLHGFEYGHMAIDISAGKGAVIGSPINGVVTALTADAVGSTILIIENERYQVTLVHGLFTVGVGDTVTLGQPIGTESNQGNTFDYLGRSCRGRDCGYHTHLNIFDKQLGANVNPLELFGLQ
jgi:murein DD-endopeptidase MepM/ murein hydrolase activator NlpD